MLATRLSAIAVGVGLLTSCAAGVDLHAPAPAAPFPARMQILSGDSQTGTVGEELRDALLVRVTDSTGQAIAGQVVNFRVVSGGGQVYAGAAITDREGRAAERWTLGTVAAELQRIEARAVNPSTGERLVFATFEARATPAAAATISRLSPDSQAVVAGLPVPVAPAVRAYDRFGNPAPASAIRVRVLEGGGTVSDSVVVADTGGRAVLREWRAGNAAGRNVVRLLLNDSMRVDFTALASAPPQQPTIVLSTRSLLFSATAGSAASAYQFVRITNGSGGTLSGLTGAISYAANQPTGWLDGALTASTAPADVGLRVIPGSLPAGTYGATVDIRSGGASNSPQSIQVTLVVTSAVGSASSCSIVAGASVIADDGTFLGTLTNKFDRNSVLNEFGSYGSAYSSTSIFNDYGRFGGEYASLSPFNPFSSRPPVLVKNGASVAFLTVNTSKAPRFDPRLLATCTFP